MEHAETWFGSNGFFRFPIFSMNSGRTILHVWWQNCFKSVSSLCYKSAGHNFKKQQAFWTSDDTFDKYLPMAKEWLSIPWRVVNILQGCQYTLGFKILCRVVNILPIIPKVGTAISCCQYSLKLPICTHKDVQTLRDCQYFLGLSLSTFVTIIWDWQCSQGCLNFLGLTKLCFSCLFVGFSEFFAPLPPPPPPHQYQDSLGFFNTL